MGHIFIYGLLLPEFRNHFSELVRQETEWIGDGFTFGRLYEINGYPGLVLDHEKKHKVYGTICQIKNKNLLQKLDTFEGIGIQFKPPYQYLRKTIKVYLKEKELESWAYLYNWSTKNTTIITEGDYRIYNTNKKLQ